MPNYILLPNGDFVNEDELYHYGVKGMKWGVRRYQNSDGTLTAAGKKQARQEYKADNKKAYELGREATIYGRAAAKSLQRSAKLENKLNKRLEKYPDSKSKKTVSLAKKYGVSMATSARLGTRYKELKAKAEAHCQSLIDKYGKDAVSSIKYKDVKLPAGEGIPKTVKTMNEKTNKKSDYLAAAGFSVASRLISGIAGLPLSVIQVPTTTGQKAARLERSEYKDMKKKAGS